MNYLPNLAIHPNDKGEWNVELLNHIDEVAHAELRGAAIAVTSWEMLRKGEVPTKHVGHHARWTFHRAWKYWIAEGPGIPPEAAEKFNECWGLECRVEGFAGGISPVEMNRGFAVSLYHIDTQAGLRAFRCILLDSIYLGEKPK